METHALYKVVTNQPNDGETRHIQFMWANYLGVHVSAPSGVTTYGYALLDVILEVEPTHAVPLDYLRTLLELEGITEVTFNGDDGCLIATRVVKGQTPVTGWFARDGQPIDLHWDGTLHYIRIPVIFEANPDNRVGGTYLSTEGTLTSYGLNQAAVSGVWSTFHKLGLAREVDLQAMVADEG